MKITNPFAKKLVSKKIPLPKFKNISDVQEWLMDHPSFMDDKGFTLFPQCLDWQFVMVNPLNQTIETDESLNTKVRCWLECGATWYDPDLEEWRPTHDYKLDTGADTFEEALANLAKLVYKNYGSYNPEKLEKMQHQVWDELRKERGAESCWNQIPEKVSS